MEGEYLYMAPSVSGNLESLLVERGHQVAGGNTLFVVDRTGAKAQYDQSQQQLNSATSVFKDMLVGKRQPELDAIRAQIRQAFDSRQLSAINLKRDQMQYKIGAIAKSQLDNSLTNYKIANARLEELQNDLKTAQLPSRAEQRKSQQALVASAQAEVEDTKWKLSQTITKAPTNSLVSDTLYNVGEWVSAGSPVVILLPPGNLKVRFFVPEIAIAQLKLGQRLQISCDSCRQDIFAKIAYISNQVEYTPPIIYSNDTRDKLIFRVEAQLESPNLLVMHPGQPVEVHIDEQ